jgi:hypothetical protein
MDTLSNIEHPSMTQEAHLLHSFILPDKYDFAARYVTLKGAWDIEVLQEDGYWPPSAIVQASRTAPRDPLTADPQIVARTRFVSPLIPHVYNGRGELVVYEYCGGCGDWQHPDAYYPDETRPNGKRGYCKTCENGKRVQRRRVARMKRAA